MDINTQSRKSFIVMREAFRFMGSTYFDVKATFLVQIHVYLKVEEVLAVVLEPVSIYKIQSIIYLCKTRLS